MKPLVSPQEVDVQQIKITDSPNEDSDDVVDEDIGVRVNDLVAQKT
ncbi:MAG TPA: hypothetical protein VEM33_00785 [Burkholderiales bacterium]|nr:hypothetical protein [Burkholderiales bacterium]